MAKHAQDKKKKNSDSAKSRKEKISASREHQAEKAEEAIASGAAGAVMAKAQAANKDPDKKQEFNLANAGYLLDQLKDAGGTEDSSLVIGPIRFSHSVQGIQIAEQRAVTAPKLVRSDKPLVIDGGVARQQASISFIFSGVDEEINNYARALVALFRVCPIVSVENEMIRSAWAPKHVSLLEKAGDLVVESGATSSVWKTFGTSGKPKMDSQLVRNDIYKNLIAAIKSNTFTQEWVDQLSVNFAVKGAGVREEISAIGQDLLAYKNNSRFVPVYLENISFQTVPDLPETLICNLIICHTDVTSVTEAGVIEYLGVGPGNRSADPKHAYWLKKYLGEMLAANDPWLPQINQRHFGQMEFHYFDKPLADIPRLSKQQRPKPIIMNTPGTVSKVSAQSGSLTNYFGIQRLIGRSTACAHHMGTSARNLSLDLLFVTGARDERGNVIDTGDDIFDRFNEFKELSDELIRTEAVYDRVMGWEVRCVIARLLGGSSSRIPAVRHGIYVPLVTTMETTETPHLKNTSISLLETNTSFADAFQITLMGGGRSRKEEREFFMGKWVHTSSPYTGGSHAGIMPGEEQYRALSEDEQGEAREKGDWRHSAWKLFWPVNTDPFSKNIASMNSSILNRDTLRAALFTPIFDKGGWMARAMTKTPIFSGKITMSLSPNLWDKFWLGIDKIGLSTPRIEDERVASAAALLTDAVDRMFLKQHVGGLSAAFKKKDVTERIASVNKIIKTATGDTEKRIRIVNTILASLAGRPVGLDELMFDMAGDPNLEFSKAYKESLFYVMTKRHKTPDNLPHVYDDLGLFAAYKEFLREFVQNRESYGFLDPSHPNFTGAPVTSSPHPNFRQTTYSDFSFLPTYKGLFKEKWEDFTPTYDDLGIQALQDRHLIRPTGAPTQATLQALSAGKPDDKVPPHIWFYRKGDKARVRTGHNIMMEKKGQQRGGMFGAITQMTLSMNLSSQELLEKFKQAMGKVDLMKDIINAKTINLESESIKTIVSIIMKGYTRNGQFQHNRFASDANFAGDLYSQAPDEDAPADPDTKTPHRWTHFYNTFFAWTGTGENVKKASPRALRLYMTSTGPPKYDGIDESNMTGGRSHSHSDISGLQGAALLRIIHALRFQLDKDSKFFSPAESDELQSGAADEAMTAVGAPKDFALLRHLRKNMDHTLQSSFSQVPDDRNSMARLWPTAKVYFVDRRGDDVLVDDLLFSTDSLLSIDITLDKDDAALAVIKFADPQRLIQDGNLYTSNTISVGATKRLDGSQEKGRKVVAANRRTGRSADYNKFLKSKKVEQGRPIMVKMGYDSVASHLNTVFTGRIAEIEMGDVVTLVCQGWKAELINRQVNFYTRNKKNWGPKDLAVMAMQLGDPDGFGAHYPQREAERILERLDKLGNKEQLERIWSMVQPGTQNVYGADAFMSWIFNSDGAANSFDMGDQRFYEGLDTRLKNIWYPDISKNVHTWFNWADKMGYPPDYTNTYWLVPIQPCWSVLKEAARHTWNNIVQVVPYDTESTLYFGQPDGLYYHTRGDDKNIAMHRKIRRGAQRESLKKILGSLVGEFIKREVRSGGPMTATGILNNLQGGTAGNFAIRFSLSEDGNSLVSRGSHGDHLRITFTSETDFLSVINWTRDTRPWYPFSNWVTDPKILARAKKEKHRLSYKIVESLIMPKIHAELVDEKFGGFFGLDADEIFAPAGFSSTHEDGTVTSINADSVPDAVRSRIMDSALPLEAYNYLYDALDGDPISVVLQLMFGMDPSRLMNYWPQHKSQIRLLLGPNRVVAENSFLHPELQNNTVTLQQVSGIARRESAGSRENNKKASVLLKKMIDSLHVSKGPTGWVEKSYEFEATHTTYIIKNSAGPSTFKAYVLHDFPEFEKLVSNMDGKSSELVRLKAVLSVTVEKSKTGDVPWGPAPWRSSHRVSDLVFAWEGRGRRVLLSRLSNMADLLIRLKNDMAEKSVIETIPQDERGFAGGVDFPLYKLDPDTGVGEIMEQYGPLIKAFMYFLAIFVQKQGGNKVAAFKTQDSGFGVDTSVVSPNMQTFRVHHYISSEKDIIANNIVASTSQMWNTVVINHPKSDPADVTDAAGVSKFKAGTRVSGGASWIYWPPTAVSKVIGLQFHPGMTLANKKLRVFTELNCTTEPLAAKLACNRLAEGMRKMYIGNLAIRGRIIKPHDRIILDDSYTGMKGPLEVESVVHHFSPEIGWVTNIAPAAVCDANPGAAAVQTALQEASYRAWLNTADWVFFALNVFLIPFTGGASSIGTIALRTAFKKVLPLAGKTIFHKGGLKGGAKSLWALGSKSMGTGIRQMGAVGVNTKNPLAIASHIARKHSLGKVAGRLMTSYMLGQTSKTVIHWLGQSATMHSWMEGHGPGDEEALPVVLSPLTFNGSPWTAGTEADEVLFTVPLYNFYYNLGDLMTASHDALSTSYRLPSDAR